MNRGRRVGLDRALGAGDGACEPKRGMGRPPRGLLESIVRSAPVLGLGVLKRRLEFPGRRSSFWRPVCLLCLTAPSRPVSEPTPVGQAKGDAPMQDASLSLMERLRAREITIRAQEAAKPIAQRDREHRQAMAG
jgi:hypothetical protein